MSQLTEAEAETKRLAAALEEAKTKLKGVKDALADASVATEKNAAATLALRQQALAQGREVEKASAALKAQATATKELADEQDKLAGKQQKVKDLLAKGFSEELPEKLRNAREGFKLFGDSQLSAGERAKALGAGLSIGKAALASYATGALGAVNALLEWSAAAREAEVRLEHQREITAALGTSLEAVRTATGGAAGASDAWTARQALLNANLRVTDEQLALIVEGARRHREAGETDAESTQRLVAAIAGQRDAQERLGITTRDGADAQERLRAVTGRLATEQRQQGTVAETAAERQARAATNTQRASDGLLAAANNLFNPFHSLAQAGGATVELFDQASAATTRWRAGVPPATQAAAALGAAIDPVKQHIREMANAENDSASAAQNMKAKTDAATTSLGDMRAGAEATLHAIKALAAGASTVSLTPRAGETHDDVVRRNVAAAIAARGAQIRARETGREARDEIVASGQLNRAEASAALGLSTPSGGAHRDPKWLLAQAAAEQYQAEQHAIAVQKQNELYALELSILDAHASELRALEEKTEQADTALRNRIDAAAVANAGSFDQLRNGIGRQTQLAQVSRGAARGLQSGALSEADLRGQINDLEGAADDALREGTDQSAQRAAHYLAEAQALAGVIDGQRQLADAMRESNNASVQFAAAFAGSEAAARRTGFTAEDAAKHSKAGFDLIAGSATQAFDAIIEGSMSAEQAAAAMGRNLLKGMADYFLTQAIAEGAAAIGSAAIFNFPGAALHAAAAAGWGLAAAGAGAIYAATAPPKPAEATSTAGTGSPARGSDHAGRGDGGNVTNVYQFNGLVTETQAARSMARIQDRGSRRGIRPNDAQRARS